ncbi:hypothetical protein VN97_g5213 [Penicillium thymicola]|uniref:Uncharacterized protein n=1 Tax=Penicillium thymicola TaxID=293382 RepID=A0AAI9TKD2_PENTH|nr:hypothetical protein VN97_g5213 [Penicillium thymicola]
MANHFASPIPLTPLQHLSPWLLLSLSPYTINIHLPSIPIIFSFALLHSISPSRLPILSKFSLSPSLTRYLHLTSSASKVTKIPVSACQYIKTPPTLDDLYSSIDNFKLEGLDPGLPLTEEYFSRLSVPNPFSSVCRVHPELG